MGGTEREVEGNRRFTGGKENRKWRRSEGEIETKRTGSRCGVEGREEKVERKTKGREVWKGKGSFFSIWKGFDVFFEHI